MRSLKTILLALGLLALSVPALAGGFCPSYGMGCYKTPKADPGFFLFEIGNKDGDYMGSLRITGGQCGCIGCEPCDESKRAVDWTAECNQRFAECEGNCFAE